MLEADVVQNGLYPDSQRRAELAQRLGVEEKTIRVSWIPFVFALAEAHISELVCE